MKQERVGYFDVLKVFAAWLVFSGHFFEDFAPPQLFAWWKAVYWGSSGKCGVAIFCIIMGALAYRSGRAGRHAGDYAAKRYLFFLVSMALGNVLQLWMDGNLNRQWLMTFLRDTVTLEGHVWQTGWCMRAFVIGSIAAFLSGRAGADGRTLLAEAALCLVLDVSMWISLCILGGLFVCWGEQLRPVFGKKWGRAVGCTVVFLIFWARESNLLYYGYGIGTLIFLFVADNWESVKKACSPRIFGILGKNAMAFYLIHRAVFHITANFLFRWLDRSSTAQTLVVLTIAYILNNLAAFPVNKMLEWTSGKLYRVYEGTVKRVIAN